MLGFGAFGARLVTYIVDGEEYMNSVVFTGLTRPVPNDEKTYYIYYQASDPNIVMRIRTFWIILASILFIAFLVLIIFLLKQLIKAK